jgi:DNA mismatch repair protein MutL
MSIYQSAVKKSQATGEKLSYTISETKSAPKASLEVQSGSYREGREDLPLFSHAESRGKTPLMPKEEIILPKKVEVRRADFTSISIQKEETENNTSKPDKVAAAHFEKTPPEKTEPLAKTEKKENETPLPEQLTIEGVLPETNDTNPIAGKGVIRGVLFNAYILYEANDIVYLIDKHAAHERILYEELKKNHKSESVQFLMEPLVLKLSPLEHASLAEHLTELGKAGFAVEEFGEGAFLVRGIPLEFISLSTQDVISVLTLAAKELMMGGRAAGAAEKRFDRTLYSMACKAAVKAGIPSTDSDHAWLVEKIREMDNVMVCPHGRPILVPLTKKEIEGMFLRT